MHAQPGTQTNLVNALGASEPASLVSLVRGATLVLAALWARVLLSAAGMFMDRVEFWFAPVEFGGGRLVIWRILEGFSFSLGIVFVAAALGGWWLMTVASPGSERDEPQVARPKLRLSIRILWIVLLGFAAITGLVWIITMVFGLSSLLVDVAAFLVIFVYAGAGAVQMIWVKSLSERIPDPGLGKFAGMMIWLFPLLAAVGCLILISPVVAFILELVIMMRLHSRLRQVRAEANAQGAEGFASWWPASTGHSGPTGTPPSWR